MGLFCGDIGHRYGDIGLFSGRCRSLLQRHGLACGGRGLFCGDIGLFGRDVGLFCGRHRALLQRHGLLYGCTGLFCRDIGHFCGDTGLFFGRCRALLQKYGLLRGCTGLFCSPTAQCVPQRRGFPQEAIRVPHMNASCNSAKEPYISRKRALYHHKSVREPNTSFGSRRKHSTG